MAEQGNGFSISALVAVGKDLVAMLRDAMLLLIALLLIGWPQTINGILVEAGFEEGSFAGLKWKAKLGESDDALLKAQAMIADLRDQNDRLGKVLGQIKPEVANSGVRADLAKLEELNAQLGSSAASVQDSLASSVAGNAPLVQKLQSAVGSAVIWGVVFGADSDLDAAKYETGTMAARLGLPNAAIYLRQGSYRSVATTTDRVQAEKLLGKARERRKDAYLVNMATWCPQASPRQGYFECSRG